MHKNFWGWSILDHTKTDRTNYPSYIALHESGELAGRAYNLQKSCNAKYGCEEIASLLSHAPDYVRTMHAALREMHRQVGDLVIDEGTAVRGMIIRHLVLPENFAGSDKVLPWIAKEVSRDSYVNIMDQYHPAFHAAGMEAGSLPTSLGRRITPDEYHFAIQCALDSGLHRGFWKKRELVLYSQLSF
jgi:uncharacterized Fe-S radical SAM superfamily protein PflX